MKIKTCKLRAADEFRAKGDVRHYLNGIHINNKYIQATNGHVAIQMDSEVKTRLDVIVRFKGKIPKSAETTKLEFSKGKNIAYHHDGMGELVSVQIFYVEEGKFPDFKRIIPNEFKLGSEYPMLNAEYMAFAHRAFGSCKNKFIGMLPIHYTDKEGIVLFRATSSQIYNYGNPIIAIMPMRQ